MARLTWAIAAAALACVPAAWCGPHLAAATMRANACRRSSQAALRSCEAGARSDNWLAVGKCDNLPDKRGARACRQQASADTKDAQHTCQDQHDARRMVCKRVGGTAYDPTIDPPNFVAVIDNPYSPLTPGTTFIYEGQTAEGLEHNEVFVTHNTRVILGVTCVEVHDTVTLNGELTEDTLDWFAQDKDGNVWYFGENSKQLSAGLVVDLEGAWMAGVDGAKPGIIMRSHPAIGDFYRQEFSLATAEDLAEVSSLIDSVNVVAGSFDGCLRTRETSPLEPDAAEDKFYAPGVGNVLTNDITSGERLELVRITTQ